MRACYPTYMLDPDEAVQVEVVDGRCHVRFGTLCLLFPSAVDAEATLDEAQLALRLLTVGGGR